MPGRRTEVDFEAVHEALERLEALDPDQGRLVELRFFGGLSIQEAAEVMAFRRRRRSANGPMARACSQRELTGGSAAVKPERWQRMKELFTAAAS